jgi:hypothetical protein
MSLRSIQEFPHFILKWRKEGRKPEVQPKEKIVMAIESKTPEVKAEKTPAAKIDPASVININEKYDGKMRRPGTKVASLYEQYRNGDTVAQWLAKVKSLGGGLGNLRKDIKLGRILLKKAA